MDPGKQKGRAEAFSSDKDNFQDLTPINKETALIDSVALDDTALFLLHSRRQLVRDSDDDRSVRRSLALKLLLLCCHFDAVACATSLLNGEVEADFVPVVNDVDSTTKMTALQTAAEAHAARCVELLLKRRARTELRSKDGRRLLPLEMALSSSRMDVSWNPDDYSVEDLVVLLSEKDLTTVKLLSEKAKAIGEVAYAVAVEGNIVGLAALLVVAAEKINESSITLHDADSGSKEKDSLYQWVIREALSLGGGGGGRRDATSAVRTANVEPDEKRKVLLREIELLQLFGAVSQNGCGDKKLTSPLIRAIKARDEAVVELLLKTDMDVNEADTEGNTALHWSLRGSWSSSSQQIKIIWLLLRHGARVNHKNKLESTALHAAAAAGNAQALQVLLLEDPDVINYKNIMRETPLFSAVKNDHIDCVELLLRWGANSEILNIRRERPMDLAKSQDMRYMLNPANIAHMNRTSPVKQKHSPCFQGDKLIFDRCEALLVMADEGSCAERISTSAKKEICKYFENFGGCARGSKCFYAHGEEELRPVKRGGGMHLIHSSVAQKIKRKIFVGGLHPLVDSDSLSKFFEDRFGSVEEAHVVRVGTGEESVSRGFGFVTFKHEKSVSEAVLAHYVTIMGKDVEIKSCIGKWDESLKRSLLQHQQEKNGKCQTQLERISEKNAEEMPTNKILEEAKADQISWVNKLLHGQPKTSSESQVLGRPMSTTQKTPLWLRTLKKWLPGFLERKQMLGQYALSSLKADFKAAFGLELDHASLGYLKLSDFMKCFPDLCRMKITPVGGCGSPNHMVLMPPLPSPGMKLLQPPTICYPPLREAPANVNTDTDSNDSKDLNDLLSDSCENSSISSDKENLSQNIPQENSAPKNALPVVHSTILQFLKSESTVTRPKLYNETKSPTGNANDERGGAHQGSSERKSNHKGRHLVLETLQRRRSNESIFFLREFDFYHNYKASVKQGKCFWCNQPKLLWANFPCQHRLWCGDCKAKAVQSAGEFDHRCVVCDVKVQKFILPYSQQSLNGKVLKTEDFPPFDPPYIQIASKKNPPYLPMPLHALGVE